jgi:aminopeptidase N
VLFVVDYPTSEGRKRMISTQLEPADARRSLPGWDEPVFKASITLAIALPETFLAISNMPVAREEPAGAGTKRVLFETTPVISSYLLAETLPGRRAKAARSAAGALD